MIIDSKVVIIGGGPVGLLTANLLLLNKLLPENLIIIDGKTENFQKEDNRPIVLSFGSFEILKKINIRLKFFTAINQIHVSRSGYFGRTLIKSDEFDLPAFGYVCSYGDIVDSLIKPLLHKNIKQIRPVFVENYFEENDIVRLKLEDKTEIITPMVIQAEGKLNKSLLKKEIKKNHSAIVANVNCEYMIDGRAFERFTNEGPLALLPKEDGYSLVWCANINTINKLKICSDADFLKYLKKSFGNRLGNFINLEKRTCFNLHTHSSTNTNSSKIISIGNSSQTLHPVAGQGLNLGFRDAFVLSKLIQTLNKNEVSKKYFEERENDRRLTVGITNFLSNVFKNNNDFSITQSVLSLSLIMLDSNPIIRKALVNQMIYGLR